MNYLLSISYDGSNYFGWAKQKNKITVQGQLELALKNLFKKQISVYGASRTDAKVHALDQKILINLDFEIDLFLLQTILNRVLPKDIHVNNCQLIDKENFHIRYSVREKEYHYLINNKKHDVFKDKYYLQITQTFDIEKLQSIFNIFIGSHDFTNFSGVEKTEKINCQREIKAINVIQKNDHIQIIFKARSFIRYQIRMIIGSALACYSNKITKQFLKNQLALKVKEKAKYKIVANGLYLIKINY